MSVSTVRVPQQIKKGGLEQSDYLLQEAGSKILQENLSGIYVGAMRLNEVVTAIQPIGRMHTNKQPQLLASPIFLDMLKEDLTFLLQEDGTSKILIENNASGQVVRVRP